MIPFNNELQVGQPAMIINVEYEVNSALIGSTILIEELLDADASCDILGSGGYAYARFLSKNGSDRFIRQIYLMPLPPLGDVYEEEFFEEVQNLKVRNHVNA